MKIKLGEKKRKVKKKKIKVQLQPMAKQRLYYLFSWLFHLDQDGDDKKNKNYA